MQSRLPVRYFNRRFPTYFVTAVMARLANEGLKLALILAAADTPAGIKLGGLLVAAFLIPSVIAAPFVGKLADRTANPTNLYSLAFAFNGISIATCGLLLGHVPSILILLLAAIGGSVGPLLTGGLSSLVGSIVSKDSLHRAYAMDVVTYNVSAILAPAIVAAIAALISPLLALLTLAFLMIIASFTIRLLQMRDRKDVTSLPIASPIDGLKSLWTIVPLRSTATATSVANIGNGVLPVAATLLAGTTFSVNAGVLLSTMAFGSLCGSLLYASHPWGTNWPEKLVPSITLAVSIPFAILTVTTSTPIALLVLAFAGAMGGPQGSAQFAVRDRFSPAPVRTQIFTLSTSLKTTFAAMGAALAGMMSGASPQTLLVMVVAANVLGGSLALFDLRTHWQSDSRLEEKSNLSGIAD